MMLLPVAKMRTVRREFAAAKLVKAISDAKTITKSMVAGGRLTGAAACEAEAHIHVLENRLARLS